MIDGLKPYPEYKDSGVVWLGDVPGHWDVRQLGRFGMLAKGNGGSKEDEVPGGVPCVRYGDIYTRYRFFIDSTRSFVSPGRASAYTPIRYGDVLFAASGETIEEIGKSAVNLTTSPAVCGGDVLRFTPATPVNPRFMGYACDSPSSVAQKSLMGRGFTVVHIYGSQLKSLWLALPPLPEQAAIARFLDRADRQIRRHIRAKQKLITLLEEQKQAIIHNAVTRGLDPKVRLKPSGVEWLGDVPEHWEVLRGKYVGRLFSTPSVPDTNLSDAADGSSMYLKVSDLLHVDANLRLDRSSLYVRGTSPYASQRQTCVVFPKRGGAIYTNKVAIVDGKFFLDPNLMGWEIGARFDAHYVALLLKTRMLEDLADVSSVPQINNKHINPIAFPAPPLREQQAILTRLDGELSHLVAAEECAHREISLLREYRTRLIADVVTGKLDVRDAAARLPDELGEPEALDEAEGEADIEADTTDDLDALPEEAGA